MPNVDIMWDAIDIASVFDFERGRENNMASLNDGNIPLVSARKVNNGVKGFVSNPKKTISGGNVISLNNDGDGGAGLAYYQPMDFALDTHVTALHPKENIPPDALLYMTTSISKQHAIFGHGRSISLSRAKRLRNMLPVSGQGGLDYAYMSEYVNKKRTIMQKRYREYIASRIAELGQTTAVASLAEKEWRTFVIQDIAEVYSGHDIYAQERTDGSTPLITAVGTNNGIGYFVGNENDSRAERSISVVRNGASVAKAFYHKYSALYGNDCRRMQLKYSESEFVNLFITHVIGMQNKAFSYSRKLGTERLLNLRIMLPITDDGAPDYKYMEQYTKNLMLRKYKQYLAYLDSKENTSPVVAND